MPTATNLLGVIDKLQSSHLRVWQHRCISVRNRNASCQRCAEACTSGCISVVDGELTVSPLQCVGCGTCATVCPTGALEAHQPDDAGLFMQCYQAMRKCEDTVVIACRNRVAEAGDRIDASKVVPVTCLGRVDESLIAMLVSLGAKRISLVSKDCESCPLSPGKTTAQKVSETANTLLAAWDCPVRTKFSQTFPRATKREDEGYDAYRRAVFASAVKDAKTSGRLTGEYAMQTITHMQPVESPRFVHVGKDKTLPHFVPPRRKRLVEALHALGEPMDTQVATRLWGTVRIDTDKCSSCRMCAVFCPTGALRKFDMPDGTMGIEHVAAACMKCRCCEKICREGAITVRDEVTVSDILDERKVRFEMKPPEFERGDLRQMNRLVSKLIGVEEVYEH